jgi:hypothetical protein
MASQDAKPKPQPDHNLKLVFIVGTEKLATHPYPTIKTLGEASDDAIKRAKAGGDRSGYELIRESTGGNLDYGTKIGAVTPPLKDDDVLRLRRPKGANA